MFVLVVGGGKVGYYLTKELSESGHEVVLMEKDRGRADQIADAILEAVGEPPSGQPSIREAAPHGHEMAAAARGEA